jgi:antitoxin (DNA-binding transcriptional repressor) of toxin-antitoxin stability system
VIQYKLDNFIISQQNGHMTISRAVSLTKAKAELLDLVRQVESTGAEFALMKRDKRVARLVPDTPQSEIEVRSGGWVKQLRRLHQEIALP